MKKNLLLALAAVSAFALAGCDEITSTASPIEVRPDCNFTVDTNTNMEEATEEELAVYMQSLATARSGNNHKENGYIAYSNGTQLVDSNGNRVTTKVWSYLSTDGARLYSENSYDQNGVKYSVLMWFELQSNNDLAAYLNVDHVNRPGLPGNMKTILHHDTEEMYESSFYSSFKDMMSWTDYSNICDFIYTDTSFLFDTFEIDNTNEFAVTGTKLNSEDPSITEMELFTRYNNFGLVSEFTSIANMSYDNNTIRNVSNNKFVERTTAVEPVVGTYTDKSFSDFFHTLLSLNVTVPGF